MQNIRSAALGVMLAVVSLGEPTFANNADAANEAAILVGAWACSGSVPGSTSSQQYRRVNDTTLALATVVHAADGASGIVHERFAFDRATGVWSLDAGKSRFYDAEHLKASAWATSDWVFTGTETAHGVARPVRVVYSASQADAFAREHQVLAAGHWQTNGTFVCVRAPLEARYDVGAPPPGDVGPTALAIAAPSRSPAPNAAATKSPVSVALAPAPHERDIGRTDRAYSLTRGTWDCTTFGGADATHTYTRKADGTIELHNVLNIAKHDYAIDETYRFDRAKEEWTASTSGGAYAGVAGKWVTDKWVFNGDMPIDGRRVPVQMIYSSLGERAFRRDFVRVQDGTPAPFAAETCLLR
jgi:hypothetical protein